MWEACESAALGCGCTSLSTLLGEGDITACVQVGGVMGYEEHAANSVGHLDEMWPRRKCNDCADIFKNVSVTTSIHTIFVLTSGVTSG